MNMIESYNNLYAFFKDVFLFIFNFLSVVGVLCVLSTIQKLRSVKSV